MEKLKPEKKQIPTARNRTALWAILGVIVGFTLPALACISMFLVITIGFGTLATQGAGTTPVVPIHLSGPLTGPAIAVIEVNGQIMSGPSDVFSTPGTAVSDDIIRQIELAGDDPDVRAIILKINSPGGSVVASDEIYHALLEINKPVIAWMGDLAASGGYYIAMASDYIYANPNSLIGSVGVISTIPNAEELLDKVGVEFNVFTSGESKDFGSMYRDMTPEEVEYWQSVLDETHSGFIKIVAEGRELELDRVLDFADGRVFTGRQALDLDMIDELGYQKDVIKKAASLGVVPGEPRIIRYPSDISLLSLLNTLSSTPSATVIQEFANQLLSPVLALRWVP